MKRLLLFDIDGTILSVGADGTHPRAFSHAIKEVFGIIADVHESKPQGKVDSQILIETLSLHGISKGITESHLDDLFRIMSDYTETNMANLTDYVLPDVRNCLQTLSHESDLMIGLLTGNVEAIAWKKMEMAGLRDYFKIGAFGDQAQKRSELVPIALNKVEGLGFTLEETYLIGDTARDIRCAKEAGCKVIAIPSGEFSTDELAFEKPDYLISTPLEIIEIVKS